MLCSREFHKLSNFTRFHNFTQLNSAVRWKTLHTTSIVSQQDKNQSSSNDKIRVYYGERISNLFWFWIVQFSVLTMKYIHRITQQKHQIGESLLVDDEFRRSHCTTDALRPGGKAGHVNPSHRSNVRHSRILHLRDTVSAPCHHQTIRHRTVL